MNEQNTVRKSVSDCETGVVHVYHRIRVKRSDWVGTTISLSTEFLEHLFKVIGENNSALVRKTAKEAAQRVEPSDDISTFSARVRARMLKMLENKPPQRK